MLVLTIVLLIVGIALLVLEMIIPGFGLPGILGLLALLGAIILQMGNTAGMLFMAALVLFIIAVLLVIFFKSALGGKFDKSRIILHDSIEGESTDVSDVSVKDYIGATGKAQTPLRPSGKATFGDKTLDVVTAGEFLPIGASVRVTQVQGLRVLVHAVTEEAADATV